MKTKKYCNLIFILIVLVFFSSLLFAIENKSVNYHQGTQGYLALPDIKTGGKYPAIILIHEWWGLNEDIKTKTREFAKAGYVALAVDLYKGQVTTKPKEARKLAGGVRENMDIAFDNLKSAISFLKNKKEVDKNRLASVGWCFGGSWSYQIAKNNLGTKASVIYYGTFNPADDLQKMKARILGHFAEKDRLITADNVKEFQAKLKTLSGDHKLYIYPNTGHGFANPNNPTYSKESSELATQRTLDFLKKNL